MIYLSDLPADHYKLVRKIRKEYGFSLSTVVRFGIEALARVKRREPRAYKLLARAYVADEAHWKEGRVRARPARQGKSPRDITADALRAAYAACGGSKRAMARYFQVDPASIRKLLIKFDLDAACHPSARAGDLPPMPEYELGPLS